MAQALLRTWFEGRDPGRTGKVPRRLLDTVMLHLYEEHDSEIARFLDTVTDPAQNSSYMQLLELVFDLPSRKSEAAPPTSLESESFTSLRDMCKAFGLASNGRKGDLVARLVEAKGGGQREGAPPADQATAIWRAARLAAAGTQRAKEEAELRAAAKSTSQQRQQGQAAKRSAEAERRAQEEAARRASEEKLAQEKAERRAKEEADRKAAAEEKLRQKAERKAQVEAGKKVTVERKAAQRADKKAQAELQRQALAAQRAAEKAAKQAAEEKAADEQAAKEAADRAAVAERRAAKAQEEGERAEAAKKQAEQLAIQEEDEIEAKDLQGESFKSLRDMAKKMGVSCNGSKAALAERVRTAVGEKKSARQLEEEGVAAFAAALAPKPATTEAKGAWGKLQALR